MVVVNRSPEMDTCKPAFSLANAEIDTCKPSLSLANAKIDTCKPTFSLANAEIDTCDRLCFANGQTCVACVCVAMNT